MVFFNKINVDFSLSAYKALYEFLKEQNYNFVTFEEVCNEKHYEKNAKIIVMRHDVDRMPHNALKMAELENQLNINSTYYIRYIPSLLKSNIIQSIYKLGHEIGYQYETLAKTSGNMVRAIELFKTELNSLRNIVPVKTICMHGSPLSSYDNRDLWKVYDFKDYDILGEPYLSVDYSKVLYLTDTSRTWGQTKLNFRDKVLNSSVHTMNLTSTQSLISFIEKHQPLHLIIQTHPERWAHSLRTYVTSLLMDIAVNTIKSFIRIVRT